MKLSKCHFQSLLGCYDKSSEILKFCSLTLRLLCFFSTHAGPTTSMRTSHRLIVVRLGGVGQRSRTHLSTPQAPGMGSNDGAPAPVVMGNTDSRRLFFRFFRRWCTRDVGNRRFPHVQTGVHPVCGGAHGVVRSRRHHTKNQPRGRRRRRSAVRARGGRVPAVRALVRAVSVGAVAVGARAVRIQKNSANRRAIRTTNVLDSTTRR